jgi:hypothetical protein
LAAYALVLRAHALRFRFGLAPFYALLGGLTAIMSWVTDAGVAVETMGITFMVGSTVFYTSLLLGVFVVYVFDGPRAARTAISTVVVVSVLAPLVAALLQAQMGLPATTAAPVPDPSLRINVASVLTTLADLVFLAVAWELLGRSGLPMPLPLRAFLTLLGVLWLDVLLFNTGAFLGTPGYLSIMQGTFLSRTVVAAFVFPVLYVYLHWESRKEGASITNRPVLAILRQVEEMREELGRAREEIRRRRAAEEEQERLIAELQEALSEVKTLRGLLPICASCGKVRDDEGLWRRVETYIEERSDARFSHGLCPTCVDELYPGLEEDEDSGDGEGGEG